MMTSAANAIASACENSAAMKGAMRRVTACLVSVVMGQRASAKSTMHGWWHTRAAQNSGRAKMQMPDECRKELEEPKAADVVAGWQCDGGEAARASLAQPMNTAPN
jgi:uncharacterized membrane protein